MKKFFTRHCEEGVARRSNPHCRVGDCSPALASGASVVAHYRSLLAMTLTFLVLAIGLLNADQVSAQGSVDIQSIATYAFGQQITFTAQITTPVQVQQATIVILDESQGVSHVRPVAFTDGRSEFVFDTQQNHIRPFSQVSWYYQLTLTDGSSVQSASQSMRYEDNRFTWQRLDASSLHVFWAQGDAAFGQSALNAALTGLQSIGNLIPVDFNNPIDVYIYPNQSDISFLSGEAWEAGRAYPDLGVALVAVELDSNQSVNLESRVPHELMHILLYRQVGAGYKNIPVWLNEGFATLAEINPSPDDERVLTNYSNNNALIPMRDLCASFPQDSASAFLAYAQARSFTTYLRDKYGAPALLNLAKVYATGMDCETGIQGALGYPLSQLDETWREKALGQNVLGVAIRNMIPYIVLLLLVIVIPFIVGSRSSQQKGN